jgi:hypothetical protein
MPYTKDRKDLEVEVTQRCVKAMLTEGRSKSGRYVQTLDRQEIGRILRYLKDRFNVTEY